MYEQGNYHRGNAELKDIARFQLQGRWGNAILGFLIYLIITLAIGGVPKAGGFIALILQGPMMLGLAKFFLQFKRTNENVPYELLFSGFNNFTNSLILGVLIEVFVALWTCLLVIPGIIALLSYSQAFYIMADNPDIAPMEALQMSRSYMNGNKGRLFLLQLSFIGWAILSIFTLGIGMLWLGPYIKLSETNFYDDLMIRPLDNSFEENSYDGD
ncbi:DUF975 family protein [Clostridium amazonitimonense]|uniref:DUF975 family protein n=1 Tax=Clostridium amazonitimonense TaxID=1499689 RepID=UPI000509B4FD|nr:DUF975 family protein [Clostridium amazonitimonense]